MGAESVLTVCGIDTPYSALLHTGYVFSRCGPHKRNQQLVVRPELVEYRRAMGLPALCLYPDNQPRLPVSIRRNLLRCFRFNAIGRPPLCALSVDLYTLYRS